MRPPVPQPLLVQPFTTATGLSHVSRARLHGPEFRRVARGAWLAHDGEEPMYGRRVQGVLARLSGSPVLAGPTAAWVWGSLLADPEDPVHVLAQRGRIGVDLVRHHGTLRPGDVVSRRAWGRVTSVERTAVDLARGVGTDHLDRCGRVARVDDLLRVTGLTAEAARRAVVSSAGLHGLSGASGVMAAVRDGVDSPKETELRLLLADLGFPEPVTQCPVRLRGRVVARLDLGWPGPRRGLEYDGAVHREKRRHSRDLERHNVIRLAGWIVLQIDHWALRHPDVLAQRVSALLAL